MAKKKLNKRKAYREYLRKTKGIATNRDILRSIELPTVEEVQEKLDKGPEKLCQLQNRISLKFRERKQMPVDKKRDELAEHKGDRVLFMGYVGDAVYTREGGRLLLEKVSIVGTEVNFEEDIVDLTNIKKEDLGYHLWMNLREINNNNDKEIRLSLGNLVLFEAKVITYKKKVVAAKGRYKWETNYGIKDIELKASGVLGWQEVELKNYFLDEYSDDFNILEETIITYAEGKVFIDYERKNEEVLIWRDRENFMFRGVPKWYVEKCGEFNIPLYDKMGFKWYRMIDGESKLKCMGEPALQKRLELSKKAKDALTGKQL